MGYQEQFIAAQEKIKSLTERPGNQELLDLYALYKQATEGDNNTNEPGLFDVKEKFKWNQWNSKQGMTAEDAMREYVLLVDTLLSKYNHS